MNNVKMKLLTYINQQITDITDYISAMELLELPDCEVSDEQWAYISGELDTYNEIATFLNSMGQGKGKGNGQGKGKGKGECTGSGIGQGWNCRDEPDELETVGPPELVQLVDPLIQNQIDELAYRLNQLNIVLETLVLNDVVELEPEPEPEPESVEFPQPHYHSINQVLVNADMMYFGELTTTEQNILKQAWNGRVSPNNNIMYYNEFNEYWMQPIAEPKWNDDYIYARGDTPV